MRRLSKDIVRRRSYGSHGSRGDTGLARSHGTYGSRGSRRSHGTNRTYRTAGVRGEQGVTGPTGATGASGAFALDPYDVYVQEGSSGNGSRADPFGTIAEGYAAVEPYGTINVLSGTYPTDSQLNLAKTGVTLKGYNQAELLLTADVVPLLITASDVTVENFTLTSDAPYPKEFIQIGGANALIKDNTIYGPAQSGPSTG